jgi:hypothetical protein
VVLCSYSCALWSDTLDFLTTSGDSFGPICGTESGSSQHIYMDLGQESGIGNSKREEREVVLTPLLVERVLIPVDIT